MSMLSNIAIFAGAFIFGLRAIVPFLLNMILVGPRQMLSVKRREERPAVLDDHDLGTHKFARLKDIRLHYVESGPEDKPLMLFIHGFPEFWYSWRHQILEFSKDFRVVAMDMRGYSESEKPPGIQSYVIDNLVEDVEQLIHYLGYEKAYVVAHDWGGTVAWHFVQKHPDMVEKMITCNMPILLAAPTLFKRSPLKGLNQLMRSWYAFAMQVPYFPALIFRAQDLLLLKDSLIGGQGCRNGAITEEDIEAYKFTFQSYRDLDLPITYYRAAMRHPPEDRVYKTRVTRPVLMIWGTRDAYLRADLAEITGEFVDDYRVKYLEGVSHWVQQEKPDTVNKYIRQFISGQI